MYMAEVVSNSKDEIGSNGFELVEPIEGSIVDDEEQDESIFAPVRFDLIDSLASEYDRAKSNIETIAEIFGNNTGYGGVVHHFIEGNCGDERLQRSIYVDKLFRKNGALASLDAAYWSKALSLTDVLDWMPQKRRADWFASIKELTTPEFTRESARSTLHQLMIDREKFFSEMIVDVFSNLSRTHVTNSPWGFGKRFILNGAVTSYGSPDCCVAGRITDLRKVIAKFMGRDEPKWNASNSVLQYCYENRGQWISVDGGSLRIRVYLKGTAHIEIHPEMAVRLNRMIANVHPHAIASEARRKPRNVSKEFHVLNTPISFSVIEDLLEARPYRTYKDGCDFGGKSHQDLRNTLEFKYGDIDEGVREQSLKILEKIGGVRVQDKHRTYCVFEYDPSETIREIAVSGCVPDEKSHQFYPTEKPLAEMAFQMADEGSTEDMEWAEPSAGTGGLADLMPKERTVCVEQSKIHCSVLRAKGFPKVIEGDFLKISESMVGTVDRVLMNPPFSGNRAQLHLEAAASLIRGNGVLVSILPASMKGKQVLKDSEWELEWSEVFKDQFKGTGVNVVILKAVRFI